MSRDHSAQKLLFIFANRTLYCNYVSQYQSRHVLRCAGDAAKLHFISKSGIGSILSPGLVFRVRKCSVFMFPRTKCVMEGRIHFSVGACSYLSVLNVYRDMRFSKLRRFINCCGISGFEITGRNMKGCPPTPPPPPPNY